MLLSISDKQLLRELLSVLINEMGAGYVRGPVMANFELKVDDERATKIVGLIRQRISVK